MMKKIDNFLNNITMYRLLLYGLFVLALLAMVFGFFGLVGYGALQMLVSLIVLFAACMIGNAVFAKLWKAPRNVESVYITALILFFVLAPAATFSDVLVLALAGCLAMASKYVLAIGRKHIFNPAAISAVIIGLFGSGLAIWWVGTAWLVLPTAIFAFLIVKKIRRFALLTSFAVTSVVVFFLAQFAHVSTNVSDISSLILSYPFFFLGGVMLTEPLTTPPTRNLQMWYGVIVGFLFSIQFHFGPVYSTPEIALVLGNIFSYIVSSKQKLKLSFVSMQKITPNVYDLVFSADKKLRFAPGQYVEWTLEHSPSDSRGNRRYFTIASSPTEPYMHIGARIDPAHSSSFKKELLEMKPGETMMAGSLAGDFTMPKDKNKKLVWIAGGIGVTPFRSQMMYLHDMHEKRDIVLMYACMTEKDFAYMDDIEKIKNDIGMKVVYVATKPIDPNWKGKAGYITADIMRAEVPDYLSRDFYLSGPPVMVENYEKLLVSLGVAKKQVHTDYFPGY